VKTSQTRLLPKSNPVKDISRISTFFAALEVISNTGVKRTCGHSLCQPRHQRTDGQKPAVRWRLEISIINTLFMISIVMTMATSPSSLFLGVFGATMKRHRTSGRPLVFPAFCCEVRQTVAQLVRTLDTAEHNNTARGNAKCGTTFTQNLV